MESFFKALFTLPGPVAAQDRALYGAFVQALADSALLEHTCKAAPRLAELWEPGASNCFVAATAPAAFGRGGCSSASGLAGGSGSGLSGSGRGGTAGAGSGGSVVARLRPEALQGCGGPSAPLFRVGTQAGPLLPQEQAVQAYLWGQMTSLVSRLEDVRASHTPRQIGA